jgi:hypothetical protein
MAITVNLKSCGDSQPAYRGRRYSSKWWFRQLWRELRERRYPDGHTAVTDVLQDLRPVMCSPPLPSTSTRPSADELCRRLGDEIDQTAWRAGILMTSMPFWNLTP